MRATLNDLATNLANGKVTASHLVEEALARIADPAGEGARAFVKVHADKARAAAQAADGLRRAGLAPSRFAGIPIAVKDLFDLAGEATPAGSIALAGAPPAIADAAAIARLKAAGFIVVGRNNMTEFAFSGVGINPHYGTPANPYDRATGRIPGGSSSGAAVSVADGMVAAAIGSDTGGSCRIPAALCGIVGYKPTAAPCHWTGRCRSPSRSIPSARWPAASIAALACMKFSAVLRSPVRENAPLRGCGSPCRSRSSSTASSRMWRGPSRRRSRALPMPARALRKSR